MCVLLACEYILICAVCVLIFEQGLEQGKEDDECDFSYKDIPTVEDKKAVNDWLLYRCKTAKGQHVTSAWKFVCKVNVFYVCCLTVCCLLTAVYCWCAGVYVSDLRCASLLSSSRGGSSVEGCVHFATD